MNLWTQWGERGRDKLMSNMKYIHYHVWHRQPVGACCTKQGSSARWSATRPRDGMGWVRQRLKTGIYVDLRLICVIVRRNQHHIVKHLLQSPRLLCSLNGQANKSKMRWWEQGKNFTQRSWLTKDGRPKVKWWSHPVLSDYLQPYGL